MSRKITTQPDFSGMTVNERLFVSGLLDRFDAAARQKKRETMIAMLQRVALSEQYATRWVDEMLGDQTSFYYR